MYQSFRYTAISISAYNNIIILIIIIIIIIIIIFAFVSRRNVVTSEAAPVTVYRGHRRTLCTY